MIDFEPNDFKYDEPELQGNGDIAFHLSESEAYLIVLDVMENTPPVHSLTPLQTQEAIRQIVIRLQKVSADALAENSNPENTEDSSHLLSNWEMTLPYFVTFATINAVLFAGKNKRHSAEENTANVVKALSDLNAEENSLLGQNIFGDEPETHF